MNIVILGKRCPLTWSSMLSGNGLSFYGFMETTHVVRVMYSKYSYEVISFTRNCPIFFLQSLLGDRILLPLLQTNKQSDDAVHVKE